MCLDWIKYKYYGLVFDFVVNIFFDIENGVNH